MVKKINSKFTCGDIWFANFGNDDNSRRLKGVHPCFVINKVGDTVIVVPISENKNNIHWSEVAIPAGEGNLKKDSKLKVAQISALDTNYLISKKGIASKKTISNVLKQLNDIVIKKLDDEMN